LGAPEETTDEHAFSGLDASLSLPPFVVGGTVNRRSWTRL
jgi:hypothetical protein